LFQQPVLGDNGETFAPGLPPQTTVPTATLTSPDADTRRAQYQGRVEGDRRESVMATTVGSFPAPPQTPQTPQPAQQAPSPPVPKAPIPQPNVARSDPAKPAPKNAAVYQDGAYWRFLVFDVLMNTCYIISN